MENSIHMNGTEMVGWTASPNGRGTFDIVLSCVFTIILCCWTTICTNLPAISDGRWAQLRDKFDLACIGLLGPEFLLGIAIGQRTSARRSLQRFNQKGFTNWTLTHAFFADMGGFVLETPDLPIPIPLDAEQLFFMVEKEYVEYPKLSKEDINDKNKADGLARLLAIGQALWFLSSSIARPIQGLSMTTLELTTISFIIIMFATSYCWFHKPSDVTRPVVLQSRSTIAQIRSNAGFHDPNSYRSTPLDFVNRDKYVMDLIWEYYINILRAMHIPLFSRPIRSRPHNRNRGDKFLRTEMDFEIFAGVFILSFSSTFMLAWNFSFPTKAELILWRCASIYTLVFGTVGGSYTWIWHRAILDKYRSTIRASQERDPAGPLKQNPVQHYIKVLASRLRKVSPHEDPDLEIPVSLLLPVTFFCAFYTLFRGYIFIEDIIALRILPVSAYDTVNWSIYLPHI